MNFDDRFLGILSMLGGINGNNCPQNKEDKKTGQGMGIEGIMNILGLMQGFQGNSKATNNSQTGNSNLDIMKILPLISTLKGGGVSANAMQNSSPQSSFTDSNVNSNEQSIYNKSANNIDQKQRGYKDKYSAISFAGNEVIYSLGKLWKTYKQ